MKRTHCERIEPVLCAAWSDAICARAPAAYACVRDAGRAIAHFVRHTGGPVQSHDITPTGGPGRKSETKHEKKAP
jgi:hypothetical protein